MNNSNILNDRHLRRIRSGRMWSNLYVPTIGSELHNLQATVTSWKKNRLHKHTRGQNQAHQSHIWQKGIKTQMEKETRTTKAK